MKYFCKQLLAVFILLISGISTAHSAPVLENEYQAAKSKIEWHCATCMGSSKTGLLDGIHQLEEVMNQGFDSAEVRTVLANAYNQMWIVFSVNEKEKELWKSKKKVLLAKSIQVYPNDDKLLVAFADGVEPYSEKIRLLEKAFSINPKNTAAGYILGATLLRAAENKRAFDIFTKAILESKQGDTFTYGREMSQRFLMQGMDKEAKEIEALIDKVFEERAGKGVNK